MHHIMHNALGSLNALATTPAHASNNFVGSQSLVKEVAHVIRLRSLQRVNTLAKGCFRLRTISSRSPATFRKASICAFRCGGSPRIHSHLVYSRVRPPQGAGCGIHRVERPGPLLVLGRLRAQSGHPSREPVSASTTGPQIPAHTLTCRRPARCADGSTVRSWCC